MSVRQCTLIVQQLNICAVILHCIQRGPHKNSSKKTKVTNIPSNFLPQQQFLQHFIKAQLQYTYFLRTDSLLCVGFAVYDCCSFCLSHSPTINPSTQTLQITQTTVAVKCKILVHFGHSFLYILCHFIDVLWSYCTINLIVSHIHVYTEYMYHMDYQL